MATVHGKSSRVFYHSFNMSCFSNSTAPEFSADVAEDTTFCDGWKTFVPGQKSGTDSLDCFFIDDDTYALDVMLNTALGVMDRPYTFIPQGLAAGNVAFVAAAGLTTRPITAEIGSVITSSLEFTLEDIGRGWLLHDGYSTAVTATGEGAALDQGAAKVGYVASLHLTELTGTTPSLTVKIEHSADNISYADLVTFSALSAAGSEVKIDLGAAVNKWLKVTWALTGTTPSAKFIVALGR